MAAVANTLKQEEVSWKDIFKTSFNKIFDQVSDKVEESLKKPDLKLKDGSSGKNDKNIYRTGSDDKAKDSTDEDDSKSNFVDSLEKKK